MSEQVKDKREVTFDGGRLTDFPIAVRDRLRFVSPTPGGVFIDPREIFIEGDEADERAFYRFCELTDLHEVCEVDPETEAYKYPVSAREMFREEMAWRAEWRELPPAVTVAELAEHLGASTEWVRAELQENNVPLKQKRAQTYIKSVAVLLRQKKMQLPDMPATAESLLDIAAHYELDEYDLERWALENNFRIKYFIKENVMVATVSAHQAPLLKAKLPFGGEWLTAKQIGADSGYPAKWVARQMELYGMNQEERFDDHGELTVHFPPIARVASEFGDIDNYKRLFLETITDPADTTALGSLFSRVAAARKVLTDLNQHSDFVDQKDATEAYAKISRARNEIIRLLSAYS